MVASEVPVLFSLVAEKFIEELTLRSWLNTEECKRRILQKNDISTAVKTSQMYDFLIFIVPSHEFALSESLNIDTSNSTIFLDQQPFHNLND